MAWFSLYAKMEWYGIVIFSSFLGFLDLRNFIIKSHNKRILLAPPELTNKISGNGSLNNWVDSVLISQWYIENHSHPYRISK